MSLCGILIMEGADASGKTTLAQAVVARYGGHYLHNGLYADVWAAHLACARQALQLADDGLVVIDRLWLSEQIYGSVYRGGPAYDAGARVLDLVLRRAGALTVLCVRKNLEDHVRHFEEMRATRLEAFNAIGPVVRAYADLAAGDLTNCAPTYLGELTRFGDYAQRDDVMLYDMDDHYRAIDEADDVARIVAGRLRGLARVRADEPPVDLAWVLDKVVR